MKVKEKQQIQSLSIDELNVRRKELDLKQKALQLERFTKPSRNTREIRAIKRTIAVVSTVLREKELAL